jgi:hypothetical protein
LAIFPGVSSKKKRSRQWWSYHFNLENVSASRRALA